MNNLQKRILVAEDEDLLRNMLVMVFKDEGYQVDSAANGKEAWDLINTNQYDLLATDLYMPELNGIELIIKCQESFPNINTLLLSGGGKVLEAIHGNHSVIFREETFEIGIFMKKPYNLNELLSIINKLLDN